MSIELLAQGDQVVKQTITTTVGAQGGQVRTPANGATLDCLVQTSGGESTRNGGRGSRFSHQVFFSSNPSLTTSNQLKWTVQAGATLTVPVYLRVLSCYSEGRPGEDLLWVADCEVDTTRQEA